MAQGRDIVWPESTAVVAVQTRSGRTLKIKIAVEGQLLFWAEDTSSRRQFEEVWNADTCKGLCEALPLSPEELADLLIEALHNDPDTKPDTSATLDIVDSQLVMKVSWEPSKYLKRQFVLQISEKNTSKTDRLEARMDDAEAHLRRLCARDRLDVWTLHVVNPYQSSTSEGSSGFFALMGNHFLIQDTDFAVKRTGVSTKEGWYGWIQATFERPVHVQSIKIAPFPALGWGAISTGTLLVQQASLEDGQWETIRSLPQETQEVEVPVGDTSVAWRLYGQYVSISKFIFK